MKKNPIRLHAKNQLVFQMTLLKGALSLLPRIIIFTGLTTNTNQYPVRF